MSGKGKAALRTSYDKVGKYDQNSINGLSEELLDHMLDMVNPAASHKILDAMAGDGNLSERLFAYCEARKIRAPQITVLEYSRVQSEFAAFKLAERSAEIVWGDVLVMHNLETNESLPDESFDC